MIATALGAKVYQLLVKAEVVELLIGPIFFTKEENNLIRSFNAMESKARYYLLRLTSSIVNRK